MIAYREARPDEIGLGCNTCEEHQENGVVVILEIGRTRANTLIRLCQPCFVNLFGATTEVANWDRFRDLVTW